MSRQCDICGRGRMLGHTVSHANNKVRRVYRVNLFKVNAKVDNSVKRIKVCTRCLRSGRVTKA